MSADVQPWAAGDTKGEREQVTLPPMDDSNDKNDEKSP